jgi:hypothetical protein
LNWDSQEQQTVAPVYEGSCHERQANISDGWQRHPGRAIRRRKTVCETPMNCDKSAERLDRYDLAHQFIWASPIEHSIATW